MLTPQTAEWLAGRVATASRERDARQLADLRASLQECRSRILSPIERLNAALGRADGPASANCDSAA